MKADELAVFIRTIPDFPSEGILFRDITPLLADGGAFRAAVRLMADRCPPGTGVIAGVESRGFIFGSAVAAQLGIGFVPIRKKGKLPHRTVSVTYDLEYGRDALEIHRDAFSAARKAVLVDDLLATGGTAEAACRLVEKAGGTVIGVVFLIELTALAGREKLAGREAVSLISF